VTSLFRPRHIAPLCPRHRAAVALAVLTVATGTVAGCSGSAGPSSGAHNGPSTTPSPPGSEASTSTSASAAPGALPSIGQYADGPVSQPHYVLDLTSSSPSTLAGTISFVYQDGRTSTVLTFSGTPSSGNAQLTTAPGARVIDATYTAQSVDLESCTEYLQYAQSESSCTFTYATTSSTTTTS
jgi:hypothetical protein